MSSNTFKKPRTRFGNFHLTQDASTPHLNATKPPTTSPPLLNHVLDIPKTELTTTLQSEQNPTDPMSTLPTEIGLEIFSLLDPVTAICLGLTNRKLYSFYLSHHEEKVVLNQYVMVEGEVVPLHRLMKDWGTEGWVYDGFCPGRFVRGSKTELHERERYVEPKRDGMGVFGSMVYGLEMAYSKWKGWS